LNAIAPEQREAHVDLSADGFRVRAGFRIEATELLAGAPVELALFVENAGPNALFVRVSGDRARQRVGEFSFTAMFEGSRLHDPAADAPEMGGPAVAETVAADGTWSQVLILNEFIRLEDTPGRLAPGAVGRLDLACGRLLPLAGTETAALLAGGAANVSVALAFDLRRDDAAPAALAARLLDEVAHGPLEARERPLSRLLAMRSGARVQIESLTRRPDPWVAERARQALAAPG
jgi:hypothetical protein